MATASAAMATASAARGHDPSPQLTADEIVLFARSSSGCLPPAHSHAALLSLLLSPSPSAPLPLYVSSLLTLASRTPRSPSLSSFLSSLLLSFLRLFRSRQIPRDGDISLLFHLFSLHLPSLDTAQLCSVLDLVVSDIAEVADPEDALPLDLLPRCLDLAVAAGSEGAAAVSAALGKILDAEWPKVVLVKVVSFLREFPVPTRARAPELLEKVFGGVKEVDVQDLPSLSYQLLLLASKGFSRRAVIGGILSFFGSGAVKGAAAIIRQVEGTVLMHFNFAVKQDPLLGQEVLRILRTNTGVFNHFAAAVLLSIARVKRLGDSCISLLRSMVVASYRDYRFARWYFINDNCGSEYIVPSSVQFGFVLLESVDGDSCGRPGISGELVGVVELGIQTLKTIFEIHDMARNEDYTILVVRKAMFRREDAIRLAATSAIVNLILADARRKQNNLNSFEESSSQASCSQQVDAPCKIGAGMLGLSNETIPPLQGERRNYYLWILSGIIEVFVNLTAIELEKAEKAEKADLQEEIVNLAVLYNSVEKDLCTKQVDGSRRGPARTFPLEVPNRADFSIKECPHDSPIKTILSTSSIHALLRTTVKLYGACISNSDAVSQNKSQSSASKIVKHCLQLVSFVLKSCLKRFKSIPLLENDDILKTLIGGDVKLLGRPLLQLIQLLKLGTQFEGNKKKEAKGVKGAENKQNPLCLSLMCLNELFKICLHKAYFVEFIEDLVTMASLEWDSEMPVDTCQEINHDQDLNSDMQEARNVNRFLNKWLKPLYSEILQSSFFQEAEILSNMMLIFGNKLPCKSRDSHGLWAVNLCRCTVVKNPRSACSIATVAVHLRLPPNDLIIAQEMALELLNVLGSEDKDPVEKSEAYPIINQLTGSTIASTFLQLAESVISDLDWTVSKLKASSISNHQNSDSSQGHLLGEKTPSLLLEEALYSRSEALVYMLSHFAKMNLKDSQAEQLLKLSAKFYKLLARTAKHQIASKKGGKQLLPGHKFEKLAEVTCKRLTVPLYSFVASMQRNQQGNAQSRKLISRIKRENKWIPELIFQIEDYEKYLIQLSRLTKVNLLRHAKRSTARDFKILDTKKISRQGDAPEDHSQAAPSSSRSEGSEESKDDEEKEQPHRILSAEVGGSDSAEVCDSDAEDQEMVVRTKRAKMRVVQDSDEEET
ncbi:hypothetical protein Taro_038280 [Colocasia esculenta]|uniref:Fanconi anemia group I protein n=1 Tax=Colocasia esculenta TaxID=4460 RepID=A0A843W694_COLES|nr:hypothetical protein [Colocasia esculenta]